MHVHCCRYFDKPVSVMSVNFHFLAKEKFRAVSLENNENKIKIPSDQRWSLLDSNTWTARSQAQTVLSQHGALCCRGDEYLFSLLGKN